MSEHHPTKSGGRMMDCPSDYCAKPELDAKIEKLITALRSIYSINPDEFGETYCFRKAQEIAKAALEE